MSATDECNESSGHYQHRLASVSQGQHPSNTFKPDQAKFREAYKQQIDEFFDQVHLQARLCEFRTAYFDLTHNGTTKERAACLLGMLKDGLDTDVDTRVNITRALTYVALGVFGDPSTIRSESNLLESMVSNSTMLYVCGTTSILLAILKNIAHCQEVAVNELDAYITVSYIMLYSCHYGGVEMDGDQLRDFLDCLFVILSKTKKPVCIEYPMKKILVFIQMLLIITVGPVDDTKILKEQTRSLLGLKPSNTEQPLKCAPQDLYDFCNEIKDKYTSFQLPAHPSHSPSPMNNIHAAIPATDMPYRTRFPPKYPPKTTNRIPEVIEFKKDLHRTQSTTAFKLGTPTSIREAGYLLHSCTYESLSEHQIMVEREHALQHYEEGTQHDCSTIRAKECSSMLKQPCLISVEKLYAKLIPKLPDIVSVLLDQLVTLAPTPPSPTLVPLRDDGAPFQPQDDILRNREIMRSSVASILLLLLKWFKVSHVLKFEYLSQLLVDSGYMLLASRAFMMEDLKEIMVKPGDNKAHGFFGQVLALESTPYYDCEYVLSSSTSSSSSSSLSNTSLFKSWGESAPWTAGDKVDDMMPTNKRTTTWILDTLRNLQMITKGKVCRNKIMAMYKAWLPLKRIAQANRGTELELYALKLLKSQVAHLGMKWRSGNMKLISAIHRRCAPRLRDDWLSTKEFDGDQDSEDMVYEKDVRAFVRLYHETRYAYTLPLETLSVEGTDLDCNFDADGWGEPDIEPPGMPWSSPSSFENEVSSDNQWNIGTPAPGATPEPITLDIVTDAINQLYRQPIKRRQHGSAAEAEADGWDAPTLVTSATNSFPYGKRTGSGNGSETDSDDDDDEESEESERKSQDDPLRNIDWETLTEEELMERMNKVGEQAEQRWLSVDIDDPSYCKVLNALEGLYVDSETGEGGITPVGDDGDSCSNAWL